jgi:hypothetical protein
MYWYSVSTTLEHPITNTFSLNSRTISYRTITHRRNHPAFQGFFGGDGLGCRGFRCFVLGLLLATALASIPGLLVIGGRRS